MDEECMLTIHAVHTEPSFGEAGQPPQGPREMKRSFILPKYADHDAMDAHFENGFLEIIIRKIPEQADRKRIKTTHPL
jgi:HSP20 family molecular chaperone IbpA